MANYLKEISSDQFESEVLASNTPVVLDFYSTECPPCEALAPKLESVAEKFSSEIKFLKIFRQQNKELARSLDVSSSPTLLFYSGGKESAARLSGGIQKKNIYNHISGLLPADTFNRLNTPVRKIYREADVIIIGAGPAGLTAGLYAAQAKLNTVVIDQAMPGGQVSTTHLISNYPGTGKPLHGYELMHQMSSQALDAGAEIYSAVDITSVELSRKDNRHEVTVDNETILSAPAIIFATGAEPRLLNIPGEKELKGKGISYCATCDGKYFENKSLIVIGGGNSAVEESIFLTRFASHITVVHQFDYLQANKTAQETLLNNEKVDVIWDSEPRKFEKSSDGQMQATIENVKTHELKTISADGVFIFIGMSPNEKIIPSEIRRNQWGYILTDNEMQTNVPGIFAVGDIREKVIRQAITAAADGCVAAVQAERYIESAHKGKIWKLSDETHLKPAAEVA
ncbi:MAG: thioredoxin-disulfide reductase [Spirochaetia bacterium]|nr:thioredoxin-disulfide reductase [Spirochaetia bacterium]